MVAIPRGSLFLDGGQVVAGVTARVGGGAGTPRGVGCAVVVVDARARNGDGVADGVGGKDVGSIGWPDLLAMPK